MPLDFWKDQSFKNYCLVTRGFFLRSHVSIDGGGFLLCMRGFIATLARFACNCLLRSLHSQMLASLTVACFSSSCPQMQVSPNLLHTTTYEHLVSSCFSVCFFISNKYSAQIGCVIWKPTKSFFPAYLQLFCARVSSLYSVSSCFSVRFLISNAYSAQIGCVIWKLTNHSFRLAFSCFLPRFHPFTLFLVVSASVSWF